MKRPSMSLARLGLARRGFLALAAVLALGLTVAVGLQVSVRTAGDAGAARGGERRADHPLRPSTTVASRARITVAGPGTGAAFSDLVNGALDDQAGVITPASDTLTLAKPAAVNPSWRAVKFSAAVDVTDATFGDMLYIKAFPYDARGNYLGHHSGWKMLDSEPFIYALPPGTAQVNYEIKYLSGANISPTDQSSWVDVARAAPPPADDYYTLRTQSMAPEFTIPDIGQSQATAWVNGHLWTSYASDDNPIDGPAAQPNGYVHVWSIDWRTHQATLEHTFNHNFGHMNAWGFSALNDDMIVGNGGTDDTLAPRFYVVPVANIDLDGTNTLASTHAITYTVPADWGNRPGMTWTDQRNVAIMDTDNATTIRKLRLRTGADRGAYGTFQKVGRGEYNGTYDVLDTYHIYDMLTGGIYPLSPSQPDQNPVWIKGRLVIPLGDGIGGADSMGMAVIRLGAHGRLSYRIHNDPDNDAQFQGFFYDARDGYMGGVTDVRALSDLYVWHSDNWTWMPSGAAGRR